MISNTDWNRNASIDDSKCFDEKIKEFEMNKINKKKSKKLMVLSKKPKNLFVIILMPKNLLLFINIILKYLIINIDIYQ